MRTPTKNVLLASVALFALSFSGLPAAAEEVLFPMILYPPGVQGRNGALWVTDFTIENKADTTWENVWFDTLCTYSVGLSIPPHSVWKNPFCTPADGSAKLQLPDDLAPFVRFQLRVRDANSSAINFGSEIPVVRTSEFLHGPSSLLDLPASNVFRRTLRVYNLSTTAPLRLRIRVLPLQSHEVLFEETAELPPPDHPAFPSEVRFDDGTTLPDFSGTDALRVELIPDDHDLPYWWFASIASSTTNEITIVSPQ